MAELKEKVQVYDFHYQKLCHLAHPEKEKVSNEWLWVSYGIYNYLVVHGRIKRVKLRIK
jgi:hypothetical protein